MPKLYLNLIILAVIGNFLILKEARAEFCESLITIFVIPLKLMTLKRSKQDLKN